MSSTISSIMYHSGQSTHAPEGLDEPSSHQSQSDTQEHLSTSSGAEVEYADSSMMQVAPGTDMRTSQDSQPYSTSQLSSGALSQSTQGDHEEPATPPTSDSFTSDSKDTRVLGSSQTSRPVNLGIVQVPLSPRQSNEDLQATEATCAGQKRTAEGMIPLHQQRSISPGSPATPNAQRHSRSTSTASSTTRSALGEMGAALRTKLSYAMIKINNGWQDMPIADVESLTSQAGSPVSSASTFNGHRKYLASPRTAIANYQRGGSDIDGDRMVRKSPSTTLQDGSTMATYESFWKSHASSQQHPSLQGSPPTNTTVNAQSASLAPPADIRPVARPSSNARRAGSRDIKPPMLTTQKLSNLGHSSQHSQSGPTTPSTPHRVIPESRIQTPTQKSIQEQDAIETLLFMSSPGNSGNMNHAFPRSQEARRPPSPLRAEYQRQERKVEFADAGSVSATSSGSESSITPRKRPGAPLTHHRKPDALDQQLDSMMDDSSDSDDLELVISPRRVTASTA